LHNTKHEQHTMQKTYSDIKRIIIRNETAHAYKLDPQIVTYDIHDIQNMFQVTSKI